MRLLLSISLILSTSLMTACSSMNNTLVSPYQQCNQSHYDTNQGISKSDLSEYEANIQQKKSEDEFKRCLVAGVLPGNEEEQRKLIGIYDRHLKGVGWREINYTLYQKENKQFDIYASEMNESVMFNFKLDLPPR